MSFLNFLIFSFIGSALSAPVSDSSSGSEYSVEAIENPLFVRHGASALLAAYRKYGITIPQELEAAAKLRKRQNGEVAAVPNGNDLQYLSPVTIGGQELNLNFDTGSSDLWVFSSQTPTSQRTGHSFYDPAASSTFQNMTGSTFSVGYGDGSSASGYVGSDTVEIGGTTVVGQAIECATDVSGEFISDTNLDGIVGLAFSSINTVEPNLVSTFFENAQSSLKKGLFTVDLRHASTGYYDFGYIQKSRYTGSIHYAALDNSQGLWGFSASNGYYVGKTHYADASGAPNGAVFDTGTTLLLMSDAIVAKYYSRIPGARYAAAQGGWIFPCTTTPPNMSVSVGTKYALIHGSTMNYATVSSTMCYGGLQSLGASETTVPYIYGDIFLKNNFAIFDAQNSRVGFAAKSVL